MTFLFDPETSVPLSTLTIRGEIAFSFSYTTVQDVDDDRHITRTYTYACTGTAEQMFSRVPLHLHEYTSRDYRAAHEFFVFRLTPPWPNLRGAGSEASFAPGGAGRVPPIIANVLTWLGNSFLDRGTPELLLGGTPWVTNDEPDPASPTKWFTDLRLAAAANLSTTCSLRTVGPDDEDTTESYTPELTLHPLAIMARPLEVSTRNYAIPFDYRSICFDTSYSVQDTGGVVGFRGIGSTDVRTVDLATLIASPNIGGSVEIVHDRPALGDPIPTPHSAWPIGIPSEVVEGMSIDDWDFSESISVNGG